MLGEPFSLHQQLSMGNIASPGTKANKRSHKKYHRGFFYDSTAAHLYFICLPGVAPCLSLIGLAVLGEIFIFFPSDMIRFVEARAEQRRRGAQSPLLPSPAVHPALCQEKVSSGALLGSWSGHQSGHLEELEYHKQPGEYSVGNSLDSLGNNTKNVAGGHSHKEREAGRL